MDGVSSLTETKLQLEDENITNFQDALRSNLQYRKKSAREERAKPKKGQPEQEVDSKGGPEKLTNFFL